MMSIANVQSFISFEENCTDITGEFVISSSTPTLGPEFIVENVLTDDGCDEHDAETAKANYWALLEGTPESDSAFTLDFGCRNIDIREVTLRNSHHAAASDRGLKDFEIHVSYDRVSWAKVIVGNLMDPRGSRQGRNCLGFCKRLENAQFLSTEHVEISPLNTSCHSVNALKQNFF